MSNNDDHALNNASEIIKRFGGIRPMAAKVDAPVTTVQGWKKRDVIPGARREQVIQAAADHNIDISDLVDGAAISNQNQPQSEPPATHSSVPQVSANTPAKEKAEEAQPSVSARRPEKRVQTHDDILAAIEENSRKTMVTSIWLVTGLIIFTGIVAAFLLLPSAQEKAEKMNAQSEKISKLENELEAAKSEKSLMKGLVPESIQAKMDNLQNQAKNIQNTVEQLSKKADTISNGVIGPDAGPISKRLQVLEEQIGSLSEGEGRLAALMDRINSLEQTVAGQEQLSQSMNEIRGMLENQQEEDNITGDLQTAQGDDDALGQTLEGVSNTDLKAAAMLIAFSQLRNAFYREEPFENDLAVLQKLVGEDNVELQTSLAKLAPHADEGVLSPEGLSQEFKGLTGDIVFSSLKGEDVSIKEKAQARLHNVFKFEKDGELVTGTPTQQTVDKAQALLDKGDVQGAIKELQSLDGEAAETAKPFIQQAEMTLLTQQVQKMLGNSILSKFTGQLPIDGIMQNMQGLGIEGLGVPAAPGAPQAQPAPMPQSMMPKGGFDMDGVKKTLEKTVPMQKQDVIRDDESGVTILPKQPSFKGFSSGE
jgi:hypothetical protein